MHQLSPIDLESNVISILVKLFLGESIIEIDTTDGLNSNVRFSPLKIRKGQQTCPGKNKDIDAG